MAVPGIWRNRDFVWLVAGQTVSEFGSSISNFALPWLLLQMTGSPLQMGLAFGAGFVPYLVLSLPAGVWADRHDRKRLMMLADACRMLLMLSIPMAHWLRLLTPAQIYVVMAGMSAFNALFDAAYVSCLPNVVEASQLAAANSALQAGVSASQILGPALAGAAVGFLGAANTVLADAASYLVSIVSLLAVRVAFQAASSARRADGGMLRQIREGLAFVWAQPLIRTISLFTLAGNLGGSAANALLLYRLQHDLHADSRWSGIVMAGVSVGAVLGSAISGWISGRMAMGRIMMVSLLLFSIPDFVTAWTHNLVLLTAVNVLLGVSMVLWNVQSLSLRQAVIPDHMRGRASASIRLLVWGSIPVGNAAGGVLGQWWGAAPVFVLTGALHAVVWLMGWRTPLYRAERIQSKEAPEVAGSAG